MDESNPSHLYFSQWITPIFLHVMEKVCRVMKRLKSCIKGIFCSLLSSLHFVGFLQLMRLKLVDFKNFPVSQIILVWLLHFLFHGIAI